MRQGPLRPAPTVMPRGFELYDEALRRCAESLWALAATGPRRPTRAAADFAVVVVVAIVRRRLQSADLAAMPSLAGELCDFALSALAIE